MGRLISFMVIMSFSCTATFAQGRFGSTEADSVECYKHWSLLQSYDRDGAYTDALFHWETLVQLCPNSQRHIFKLGRKIIHNLIATEPRRSKRKQLIQKLHWLYEKWIDRDGESQDILDFKKQDFEKYEQ